MLRTVYELQLMFMYFQLVLGKKPLRVLRLRRRASSLWYRVCCSRSSGTTEKVRSTLLKLCLNQRKMNFVDFSKPMFKREVTKLEDLKVDSVVVGKVQNAVTFGVFVDIGVGTSGLLHISKLPTSLLKDGKALAPGDTIEVRVLSIQKATAQQKARISLSLVRVL